MPITNILDQLIRDERKVSWVYDDANGQPIVSGTLVIGNPTAGIGRNLSKGSTGLSDEEILMLEGNDESRVDNELTTYTPWARKVLDPVRYGVMQNMTFNMGIFGLMKFTIFLSCMQRGDWTGAAAAMTDSKWFKQIGDRAIRLRTQILTGVWQ